MSASPTQLRTMPILWDGDRRPTRKRWHLVLGGALVLVLAASALSSHSHDSLTAAARDFVSSSTKSFNFSLHPEAALDRPTVAIAPMERINAIMRKASGGGECGWGVGPRRESTRSAYREMIASPETDFPYYVTNTDQFALDDVLTTRFLAYTKLVPLLSSPAPDFIFLPVLSQIWTNPWGCGSPVLAEGIKETTQFLADVVHFAGNSTYPRVILPISPIRSQLERGVLTPEFMEEIKDSVVLVSIENAPKNFAEGMKYTIDVPYPTAFHLSPSHDGNKTSIGTYFSDVDRPYLLHYAGAATHPWGLPPTDPFNGFALRAVLSQELKAFEKDSGDSTSKIIFDEITNSMDGAQQLDLFHQHMQESTFCLMPAGDSPTRRATYEALLLGCIPVIFREHSYGRLFPSSPEINDMSKYTVFVEENDLINSVGPSLIERLEAIPASQVRKMQEHIRRIAPSLQWSFTDREEWFDPTLTSPSADPLPSTLPMFNRTKAIEHERTTPPLRDAFETLLTELTTIKRGEWIAGVARDNRLGTQEAGSRSRTKMRRLR
ncbi:hypothetical protein JCM10212_002390 [Sporobolomyces blumeae]